MVKRFTSDSITSDSITSDSITSDSITSDSITSDSITQSVLIPRPYTPSLRFPYSRLLYWGAGKSLARPGRKQTRKHVKDARDFNIIETRAVIKFLFSCNARRRRKFTPF